MALDKLDKRIIEHVQRDGRVALSRISETVGVSHVAIKRRLDKLEKNGLIDISTGLSGEKLDLKFATVTVEVENYEKLTHILDQYEDCPRMIYLSSTGGSNILAVLAAEDLSTLESVLGTCCLRTNDGVRRSSVEIGKTPRYPKFLPIRIIGDKLKRKTPCGLECRKCGRYSEEICLGCPATRYYRGSIL